MATDAYENTRRRRIEESVEQKSVEKQIQGDQFKQEQDIARSKEDFEELNRQYRSRLFEEASSFERMSNKIGARWTKKDKSLSGEIDRQSFKYAIA